MRKELEKLRNEIETLEREWMPDAPLLLTYKQAAALINVSKRTVENLVARGELVRRKIGAASRIPRSSIESFLRRDHATAKK